MQLLLETRGGWIPRPKRREKSNIFQQIYIIIHCEEVDPTNRNPEENMVVEDSTIDYAEIFLEAEAKQDELGGRIGGTVLI